MKPYSALHFKLFVLYLDPLSEIIQAHLRSETGRTVGKIAIRIVED